MSRTANSRRLAATSLRKFRGEAADAGLGREWRRAPCPGPRRRTPGCAPAGQVGALRHQRVEPFQIGLHRVDRLAVERELEQRRAHSAPPCRIRWFFACHLSLLLKSNPQARRQSREARRKPLDFKGVFGSWGPSPNPTKIARFRNIAAAVVQHFRHRNGPSGLDSRPVPRFESSPEFSSLL